MTTQSHQLARFYITLASFLALFFVGAVLAAIPQSAHAQTTNVSDPNNPWCYNQDTGAGVAAVTKCFPDRNSCNTASNNAHGTPCFNTMEATGNHGILQKISSAISSAKSLVTKALDTAECLVKSPFGCVVKWIANFFFYIAGLFVSGAGFVLDFAIDKTITSGWIGKLHVIDVGWRVVRDACNMVYLFILLYIAIQTILGIAGANTKRMVANVIISALLINFSLFFTKVVIDAGNIVGKTFWDMITVQQGTSSGTQTVSSASSWLMTGSKLQTAMDPESEENKSKGSSSLGETQKAVIYLGGAIIFFVLGMTFLSGAAMMVGRTVGLIFAMIFSPFAFLGLALPKYNYFHSWFGNLIRDTFSAPILIFFLYLITYAIRSGGLMAMTEANGSSFACFFSGTTPACFTIIFNYMILIALILGALKMASSLSSSMGSKATSFVKMGAVGVSGAAARNTVGRSMRWVARSEAVQRAAARKGAMGAVARLTIVGADKASSAKFGGKQGYKEKLAEKDKRAIDRSKLFTKAEAQERSLRSSVTGLGKEWTGPGAGLKDRYDSLHPFDKQISEAKKEVSQKQMVDKAVNDLNGLKTTLASLPAGASLAPADEQRLRAALATVGKEAITKVDDAVLQHAEVIKRMSGEAFGGINEAAILNPKMRAVAQNIRQHVVDGKGTSTSAKEYVRKLEPNSAMYINFAREVQNAVNAGNSAEIRRFVDLAGPKNIPEFSESLIKELGRQGHLNKSHLNAVEQRVPDGIYTSDFVDQFIDEVRNARGPAVSPNPNLERLYQELKRRATNNQKADSPFYDLNARVPGRWP